MGPLSRPVATEGDEKVRGGVVVPNRLAEALNDPHSPEMLDALTRRCDACGQPPEKLCARRHGIRDDLAGRLIHVGRMHPATPPRKGKP